MNQSNRRNASTFRRVYSTVLAVGMLLVACSSPTQDTEEQASPDDGAPSPITTESEQTDDSLGSLIEAAQDEGGLTIYGTPSEDALQADADAFEEEYGIPVEVVRLTAGPFTPRVDEEFDAGNVQADVLMTTDVTALDRWWENDQLQALPEVDYPTTTEYYAPIQVIGQGLLLNTDGIPDAEMPTTWEDLLDDRWDGRIALGSPRIGPGYMSLYYALVQDENYGEEYFEQLAELNPRIIEQLGVLPQSVVAGEVDAGFTAFEYLASNILAESPDAPVGFTYLDIATVIQTNVAIVANGPHPNAGLLFGHWIMSEDGQATHNGDMRAASPLGDFEGTLSKVPDEVAVTIPIPEVVEASDSIIEMFDRIFG